MTLSLTVVAGVARKNIPTLSEVLISFYWREFNLLGTKK